MNQNELDIILDSHEAWLNGNGERARILNEDLSGLDFSNRDLRNIDLRRSDLTGCNLSGSDLTEAILVCTNCTRWNIAGAIIDGADFEKATGIDFTGAIWNGQTVNRSEELSDQTYCNTVTDIFIRIGCLLQTFEQWDALTDNDRRSLDQANPEQAVTWWQSYRNAIETIYRG